MSHLCEQLVKGAQYLESVGMSRGQLSQLHHASLNGKQVSFGQTYSYFGTDKDLKQNNIQFAERLNFITTMHQSGHHDLASLVQAALTRYPLNETASPKPACSGRTFASKPVKAENSRPSQIVSKTKELGDAGEKIAADLLRAHGYEASLLPTNHPTYDIKATRDGTDFYISVKVSRQKQHVRLGTRQSVFRLIEGSFVFAFLPRNGSEVSLEEGGYHLWIIPGQIVKRDSLAAHDSYWAEKGGDSGYSVIVKGYDRRHDDIWKRWSAYEGAWNLLP